MPSHLSTVRLNTASTCYFWQ